MKFSKFRLKSSLITLLLIFPYVFSILQNTLPKIPQNIIITRKLPKNEKFDEKGNEINQILLTIENPKIEQPASKIEKNSKFLDLSHLPNVPPNAYLFDYSNILKYIGNKSFMCIILLYFQYSPYTVFLISLICKSIVSYYYNFISWKIFDVLPEEVFQIVGMAVYLLISFSILYNLMFYDEKFNLIGKLKNKKKQNTSESLITWIKNISLNDLDAIVKIFGIILISLHDDSVYFSKETLPIDKLTSFSTDILANFISILAAMLVGYCLSMKFYINCNLLFTSITFLIMGIDISVKLFSRKLNILKL